MQKTISWQKFPIALSYVLILKANMGISVLLDIFQEKMSGFMESHEYVKTYLKDDILTLTKESFNYY